MNPTEQKESVIQKMRSEARQALEKKTFQYWTVQRHWQGNATPEMGKPLTVAKAITACNVILKDLNPSTRLSRRTYNLLDAIINKPDKVSASG